MGREQRNGEGAGREHFVMAAVVQCSVGVRELGEGGRGGGVGGREESLGGVYHHVDTVKIKSRAARSRRVTDRN